MARRGFWVLSPRVQGSRAAPLGAVPPKIPGELVPNHVAVVMDGNGRWAKDRGLPRTEGHKVGEGVVLDVLKGCLEMGVKNLSLYAFSTENWEALARRGPLPGSTSTATSSGAAATR
ncbi:Ditrans,polycis-undecaprenyl-diphosphate synthase ((2E,6E)-farnesyl-diphosphate specific) [Streptomyces avidinii]